MVNIVPVSIGVVMMHKNCPTRKNELNNTEIIPALQRLHLGVKLDIGLVRLILEYQYFCKVFEDLLFSALKK